MKKILSLLTIATIAALFYACGDSTSAKGCQNTAYCIKSSVEADKCWMDEKTRDAMADQAKEAGTLINTFEKCNDF